MFADIVGSWRVPGRIGMKILSLVMWVGQFGFSILFPTLLFLLLGVRLQETLQLGVWVVLVCGLLGLLTSFSTARACLRSLRKAAEDASGKNAPPIAFNDHK